MSFGEAAPKEEQNHVENRYFQTLKIKPHSYCQPCQGRDHASTMAYPSASYGSLKKIDLNPRQDNKSRFTTRDMVKTPARRNEKKTHCTSVTKEMTKQIHQGAIDKYSPLFTKIYLQSSLEHTSLIKSAT